MELPSEIILSKCLVQGGENQYLQAVQRWHESPHIINRRISTSITMFSAVVLQPENGRELLKLIVHSDLSSNMDVSEVLNSLSVCGVHFKEDGSSEGENHLHMVVKKLLPRYSKVFKEMIQITISDLIQKEYIFLGLPHGEVVSSPLYPVHPFSLKFITDEMLLMVFSKKFSEDKSAVWLRDCLFPKLQRWADDVSVDSSKVIQSLSLIPADQYSTLYQRLKEKYGQKMVEIWPERTDPQKFVFEDVAIATYLLLLWETQRTLEGRPEWHQSFVDMGCGNGLLVYILNSEGHRGSGVDVRKRGIWDLYPSSVELKVQTFVPSNCNLFPEVDWVIGNHSDELTPWIPVIAARSSYHCSFFLLPCCAYNFNGSKYQRKDSSRSQYSEYLDYIKSVCEKCGFKTELDRLKIPSTKRICLISSKRDYPESEFERKQTEIMEYIHNSTEIHVGQLDGPADNGWSLVNRNTSNEWAPFVPRESKEEVRNCTQLQKDIINVIVQHVVKVLLSEEHRLHFVNEEGQGKIWNAGGCMQLGEIAASLPQNLMMELKKEYGGLQTLLKNNHQIFFVTKGTVKIAVPGARNNRISKRSKKPRKEIQLKVKQKPCWFFNFHPDGCPLKNEECTFCH